MSPYLIAQIIVDHSCSCLHSLYAIDLIDELSIFPSLSVASYDAFVHMVLR